MLVSPECPVWDESIFLVSSGYLVGAPLLAGVEDTLDNNQTNQTFIERSSINIWQPGNILCAHHLTKYTLYINRNLSETLIMNNM